MSVMKRYIKFVVALGISFSSFLVFGGPANGAPTQEMTLTVSTIGEGKDFASQILGMPWNMQSPPYPDFPTVFDNVSRASFSANGDDWTFTASNNDPSLWILWPNLADSQHVLKLGDRYPINASVYHLISFRLCSDQADVANVYWFDRPLESPVVPAGDTEFIQTASGCHLYVIDLETIPKFNGTWAGLVSGLRLDPAANNSDVAFGLDWIRLTSFDPGHTLGIQWQYIPNGSDLEFYLNNTCSLTNAELIGAQQAVSPDGTFQWGASLYPHPSRIKQMLPVPASFEPGNYTVVMRVGGSSTPICTATDLEIVAAPVLTYKQPSTFSGPDYATDNIADPWGMANSEDIEFSENLSSLSFAGGILDGVSNSTGDPALYLNTSIGIDTSKYHHVTFRYQLDGNQDIGLGWVLRFLWYTVNTVDLVTIEDTIVYEGWHTYSMDLDEVLIDPIGTLGSGWEGAPTTFRMDPHEVHTALNLHLDFVTLTGDEMVASGDPFDIIYHVDADLPVNIDFFYDDDTNPSNGRTAMVRWELGAYSIFLPLIQNGVTAPASSSEIEILDGSRWQWDTSSVTAGSYFVSADISDGYNITTWSSDVPVIVE